VNPYASKFSTSWTITWIVNPIGIILSIILLKKRIKYGLVLLLLNILLFLSFGPMWFLGDLYNLITDKSK
jgi:hypothetical protein